MLSLLKSYEGKGTNVTIYLIGGHKIQGDVRKVDNGMVHVCVRDGGPIAEHFRGPVDHVVGVGSAQ